MKVRFGVYIGIELSLPHRSTVGKFQELVKVIDGYGIDAIVTYDSSFVGTDAYVRATLIAQAASHAQVGIHPTNPITREPQIMTGFLGAIDALTEGRAFLSMGSGDSAVYNIGKKAATRARMEDYITCIQDLLATGEATYDGRPQRIRWAPDAVRDHVPIVLCAEGPKTLHLGGRICDGVIAGTGLSPEVIDDTKARIHGGAVAEGRNPEDVEVWFTARSALHEDRETAHENVYAFVSSILNHSMRFGLEEKHVPGQFRDAVQQYVDEYALYEHIQDGGSNPKHMQDLGLTDYAMERFALAGNPKDWIERIEELAARGATNLWINAERQSLDEQIHYMKLFGKEILPHFQ